MDKKRTSISVVIPAHNSRETIERVLEALLPELQESDELIVIDDRSTDDTATLAKKSEGVSVYSSGNKPGAAGARNAGAQKALGEWLLFVDSDAVAPEGWRGCLIDYIDQGEDAVQAIYGPDAPGTDAPTFYKNFYYHYTFTRRIRSEHIAGCGTFFFAVRRSLFIELNGFDDNIPGATVEDADFAARLVARGHRIRLAKDMEVFHLRAYNLKDLLNYEWKMMKSKAMYMLRRDSDHGTPSVSMASPFEMLPVLLGAIAVWPLLFGLLITLFGASPGIPALAAGGLIIAAGHAAFWKEAVIVGGWRGLKACWITIPDLALILPASAAGLISSLSGKKY
jgi:glycosyltransferase involved in cell wall biosynthesis